MPTNSASSSSSQRVFDDENLLTEILLRLPTKPLAKLKSICKRWNSIVSSGSFARLHTLLHPPNTDPTSGVFLRITDSNSPNYKYHFLSLPFGPLSRSPLQFQFSFPAPKLVQSCNGLLLFSSASHSNYCIYNPATNQSKTLPQLALATCAHVLGVSLGFDPPRFDGFRVVCVITTESSAYSYRIFSYHSSIGSWKEWEGSPFSAPFDVVFSSGVYWNGAFHWISLREDSVYFDVESQKLSTFPSPPISPKMRGYRQFCEFNGNLHYVDVDAYRSPVCKIFALVDYELGWILKYSVYVPEMLIGESRGFSMLCLVRKDGEERGLEMVVHVHKKIMAYDLERNNWRTICWLEFGDDSASSSSSCLSDRLQLGWFDDASSDQLQFGWFDACAYTATLALFDF